jgi:hypothetical protein
MLTDAQISEAAQNLPVVVRTPHGPGGHGFVRVDGVYACLWNEGTGEVVSIDDEDVGPGFVVAIAVGVKG